jgi:peptidoglycan/LPS O-acetylase OafA/YrhL
MSPAERAGRAAGLDGLRGLAALCVFLVHIWIYSGGTRPVRDNVWDYAIFEMRLTVIFFFILSGYLLYRDFARAALRRDGQVEVASYAKRRAARILPAYYLAMIGSFALLWGAGSGVGVRLVEEKELPLFALFAQNYSPDTILRFNPVTWTLCLEVAFYTLLPLLGYAAYRLGGGARRQALALGSLAVLGVVWNLAVYLADLGSVASRALPVYMPYFVLGMLLTLWLQRRSLDGERPSLGPGATAALVAAGFTLVALNGLWHASAGDPRSDALILVFHDLPAGIGFAGVIAAVLIGRGPAVSWLRIRQLVWVGIVSYGFYLWHVPLILFAKRLGVLPTGMFAAFALALPPALLLGAASWRFIERPLMMRAARAPRARRASRARTRLEARTAP